MTNKLTADLRKDGLISIRSKSGCSIEVLAASFSGLNVPSGVKVREILVDLPVGSKQEFIFVANSDGGDAKIIVFEWAEEWPDEDADTKVTGAKRKFLKKQVAPNKDQTHPVHGNVTYLNSRKDSLCSDKTSATGNDADGKQEPPKYVPFAFLDLQKHVAPSKDRMYSISGNVIYLNIGKNFCCSDEIFAVRNGYYFVSAEDIIMYILGKITWGEVRVISTNIPKKSGVVAPG